MSDIITKLGSKPFFYTLGCVSEALINTAEQQLGLSFFTEYRKYIATFGIASVDGHELTGICTSPRLNVVDVTSFERNRTPTAQTDWYVIEQANIDGIVIWQSSNGEVYQTSPNADAIKLCDSLCEYLDL